MADGSVSRHHSQPEIENILRVKKYVSTNKPLCSSIPTCQLEPTPHVYEHYAVVPTKSEAIWIAKKLAGELKTKALKDFSVTVSQQMCVNGVYSLKTTHIVDEQGYRKIKADV